MRSNLLCIESSMAWFNRSCVVMLRKQVLMRCIVEVDLSWTTFVENRIEEGRRQYQDKNLEKYFKAGRLSVELTELTDLDMKTT